jgi:hypothetical protein
MTDLHSRIATEIDRRLAVARAATKSSPAPWGGSWDNLRDANGLGVAFDVISEQVLDYLAQADPSDSIRRLEAASRVLNRHQPADPPENACIGCPTNWREEVIYGAQQCPELLDLAASLGLDTEGSTTDG